MMLTGWVSVPPLNENVPQTAMLPSPRRAAMAVRRRETLASVDSEVLSSSAFNGCSAIARVRGEPER